MRVVRQGVQLETTTERPPTMTTATIQTPATPPRGGLSGCDSFAQSPDVNRWDISRAHRPGPYKPANDSAQNEWDLGEWSMSAPMLVRTPDFAAATSSASEVCSP